MANMGERWTPKWVRVPYGERYPKWVRVSYGWQSLEMSLKLLEDLISTAKVGSYEHAWTRPDLDVSPLGDWYSVHPSSDSLSGCTQWHVSIHYEYPLDTQVLVTRCEWCTGNERWKLELESSRNPVEPRGPIGYENSLRLLSHPIIVVIFQVFFTGWI